MTAHGWRYADRCCLVALAGWIGYAALATNVFGERPWPEACVDYRLIYDFSQRIVAELKYPARHAYPPPAIVLHYAQAQLPFPAAAAIHMALTVVAALGCWWILARMLKLEGQSGTGLAALAAFAASAHFWCWDLRSQNCNLIFLATLLLGAAALAANSRCLAGFGLALSVSLKLFSILVIPYLAWKRHWRALGWTIAWLSLFWLGLPMLVFRGAGAGDVYRDWYRQLGEITATGVDLEHPILTSLLNSAAWIMAGDSQGMRLVVWPIVGLWGVIGACAAVACWRRIDPPGDFYGLLADLSVLVLAPVAASPYLEPYHPVAFAITAFLLLAATFDRRQAPALRALALGGFLTSVVLSRIPLGWELRGLMINLQLLAGSATLVAVAWIRRPVLQSSSLARDACASAQFLGEPHFRSSPLASRDPRAAARLCQ